MRFIAKYGIGLYLIVSLLFKLGFIIPMSIVNVLYMILMGLGVILFFGYSRKIFNAKNQKAFGVLYLVILLNLIYLIIINFNSESVLYVLAKFSTTNLIAIGLITNFHFYKRFIIRYFKYIIGIILILGYFFGNIPQSTAEFQRLSIGFNPNDVGLFGSLGALSILVFNAKWFRNKYEIAFLFIFILLTLLSGSKSALLNLVVGVIFIYGFSPKIFIVALGLFLVFSITPKFGYITSIDRLLSKENPLETRHDVFELGLKTINDAFWEGHGIDKYGWTDPQYWSAGETAFGPHNTYLSVVIMYGIVFGSAFMLILFSFLVKAIRANFKNSDIFIRFCALVVVLTLINGFFETLVVGVNEFITVLFWFAVGVLGFYKIDYAKYAKHYLYTQRVKRK